MNRLYQLDSLRGIAALSVFLNHMFLAYPIMAGEIRGDNWITLSLKYSPFSLIWAGHEAVLIFFILSGFVLSLAFYSKPPTYRRFIVKRLCRLYIPYIVVLSISIVMNFLFYSGHITGVSNWLNSQWTAHITWKAIVAHILFIDDFNTHAFDPPIWSLVHEMRISIIFPFLMIFIIKYKWKSIYGAFLLSVTGFALNKIFNGSNISYFLTLHYASMFIFGALLAMYRDKFNEFYNRLSKKIQIILICVISPLMLSYAYWFMPNVSLLHFQVINDWVASIGALIIIGGSLTSSTLTRLLNTKFIAHMGKISYSFYLTHFVVFITLINILLRSLSIWAIWLITFVVTFSIATILYLIIENPSIKLGKLLTRSKQVIVKKQVLYKQ